MCIDLISEWKVCLHNFNTSPYTRWWKDKKAQWAQAHGGGKGWGKNKGKNVVLWNDPCPVIDLAEPAHNSSAVAVTTAVSAVGNMLVQANAQLLQGLGQQQQASMESMMHMMTMAINAMGRSNEASSSQASQTSMSGEAFNQAMQAWLAHAQRRRALDGAKDEAEEPLCMYCVGITPARLWLVWFHET